MKTVEELLCVLGGYVVGSVNPSYIIARIKGFDIRTKGSKNAGASNAVITMGKWVGIFSALFDIFKAFAVTRLAEYLFPECSLAFALSGSACILGHIFPALLGFRGGKGLACLAGVLLSFDWRLFLVFLGAEAVIVLVTDYICFVPMTASVAFTAVYAVLTKNALGTLAFTVATLAILFRHLDNLKRIKNGDEAHFSLLWKRQEEVKRIGLEEEDRKWQARNKNEEDN